MTHSNPRSDTSPQATGLARLVDRVCRLPGRYLIILDVPDHRRRPWHVEIARLDTLRRTDLRRHQPPSPPPGEN